MPRTESAITNFHGFLQDQGLKLTSERAALVREIFSIHYHFEADELLFKMKEKSVKISRATVYRTLELLVKSGLVVAFTSARTTTTTSTSAATPITTIWSAHLRRRHRVPRRAPGEARPGDLREEKVPSHVP